MGLSLGVSNDAVEWAVASAPVLRCADLVRGAAEFGAHNGQAGEVDDHGESDCEV